MKKIAVIGGGAAGMMSAIAAYEAAPDKNNLEITIYEKNDRLGKKLFITGKGRCNLTNHSDMDTHLKNTVTNPRFMYSSLSSFDSESTEEFFKDLGLKIKVERGNRVFPLSDHSSDVISVLSTKLKRLGINVMLSGKVQDVIIEEAPVKRVKGIKVNDRIYDCDILIIATGGMSYPATGSTGDGYRFAEKTGHRIEEPKPALVPFEIKEDFCRDLMGLSLRNVSIKLVALKNDKLKKDKIIYEDFGEMLFTHFGVSGPLILSASSYIHKYMDMDCPIILYTDLKPALSEDMLDSRILRDFETEKNKQFRNSLDKLLPKKLIPEIVRLSGINPEKRVNEVTREERMSLVRLIKKLPLTVTGLRGFDEAIITKGGVSVKDINPKTMESKQVDGLYFAGEVIDTDCLTGGFNLQVAWSTGHAAGAAAGVATASHEESDT